jgi:hypothetical protein
MRLKKTWVGVIVAATSLGLNGASKASCECRCVDGQVQPLCSSSIDLPPICAPQICAIVPPSIVPNSSALDPADRHIAMRATSGFESLHPPIRVAASMPMSGLLPTRKRVSLFERCKWTRAAALAVMIGTGAAHAQSDKMTFILVGTGGNCNGSRYRLFRHSPILFNGSD